MPIEKRRGWCTIYLDVSRRFSCPRDAAIPWRSLHYGDEFTISRVLEHPDCPPSTIRAPLRTTGPRLWVPNGGDGGTRRRRSCATAAVELAAAVVHRSPLLGSRKRPDEGVMRGGHLFTTRTSRGKEVGVAGLTITAQTPAEFGSLLRETES
jgi:hypothetical protein